VKLSDLRPVDRLEITVIVDNLTDGLSTTPKHVVSEWAALQAAGRLPVMSGEAICQAHHGLSLLITAHRAETRRTVLMDAGPEGATFLRNSRILGVDFADIDAVVLSHGHWDHGGGLPAAVGAIAGRRQAPVECFLHPGMFAQRASRRPDGTMYLHEILADPDRLATAGARPVVTRDATVIADGMFWISGEIPRVTPYEVGLPGHVRRSGEGWEPDPLIMDERFLAVRVRERGLVVFSSCSHAGIVNVLTRAVEQADAPIYGVMGGFHLSGNTESIIPETLAGLQRFGPKVLAPGHCTGWRALAMMARMFGDELIPSSVGKRYDL
jgi:7,8-dihydropterin-6-yl-methyl-4-(beta-D-ribofuranosyl)aminobenzene 5'-phosphate synthase